MCNFFLHDRYLLFYDFSVRLISFLFIPLSLTLPYCAHLHFHFEFISNDLFLFYMKGWASISDYTYSLSVSSYSSCKWWWHMVVVFFFFFIFYLTQRQENTAFLSISSFFPPLVCCPARKTINNGDVLKILIPFDFRYF